MLWEELLRPGHLLGLYNNSPLNLPPGNLISFNVKCACVLTGLTGNYNLKNNILALSKDKNCIVLERSQSTVKHATSTGRQMKGHGRKCSALMGFGEKADCA